MRACVTPAAAWVAKTPLPVRAERNTAPPSSASGNAVDASVVAVPALPTNCTPPGASRNGAAPAPWPANRYEPAASLRFATASSCARICAIWSPRCLRSTSLYAALPAATIASRACCTSEPASASALSVCVIALRLASTARWLVWLRTMAAVARSARAAAAGSSLALLTRFCEVMRCCDSASSDCARCRLVMPASNDCAVLILMACLEGKGDSSADLEQRVEDRLRDLQHLGRRLVALLVLDQARRFLVEVDTRARGLRFVRCTRDALRHP